MTTHPRMSVLFAIACAGAACDLHEDSIDEVELAVDCSTATNWAAGVRFATGALARFAGAMATSRLRRRRR
jgi:hypothetical protein